MKAKTGIRTGLVPWEGAMKRKCSLTLRSPFTLEGNRQRFWGLGRNSLIGNRLHSSAFLDRLVVSAVFLAVSLIRGLMMVES